LKAAFMAAFLFGFSLYGASLLFWDSPKKVFNTLVHNSVEKHSTIFVSDSTRDGLALCTESSAGTFVVLLLKHVRHFCAESLRAP
jgi:hypothetical protein